MSNEELVTRIQAGDTALIEDLCTQNAGLILKVIQPFLRFSDEEDLVQTGYIGLLEAVKKYDPEKGAAFSSYAWSWIKSTVYRYVKADRTVYIPESKVIGALRLQSMKNDLFIMLGRDPDDEELRAWLEVNQHELDALKRAALALQPESIETPIAEDLTIADSLKDPADDIAAADDRMDRAALASTLWAVVDGLPDEQGKVIRERYQKDGNHTMKEVGAAIGITESKARSIHDRAIKELRRPKNTKLLQPFLDDDTAYSWGLKGTGLTFFKNNLMSSVERAVIKADDRKNKKD